MPDWVIKDVNENESQTEDEETDQNSQDEEEKKRKDRSSKQERQKRKAEIEAELNDLEDQLQGEAAQAAEQIAEEEPENSEVKQESKDEAEAIAAGHKLTNEEESRLAEAISTKVMEKIGSRPAKQRERSNVPDRKPKPTHWSERRILGKNRSSE